MVLKRRELLKQTGGLLTALGLGQSGLLTWAGQAQSVLAQPTRRKLALLVGINQYSNGQGSSSSLPKLAGCVTDVELQRELLIHRFGFQPSDILVLTDKQATGDNIQTAFQTHLMDQAQSGDVVIVHFSGYGRRYSPSQSDGETDFFNALVPVDGGMPPADAVASQDLLLGQLQKWLEKLPTQQVTTVLDTGFCFSESLEDLGFRVRSQGNQDLPATALPNVARNGNQFPGVIWQAGSPQQWVVEVPFPTLVRGPLPIA